MIPYNANALKLLQEGTIAFAKIEQAGIRIDRKYLRNTIEKTKRKINRLEFHLKESELGIAWQKKYRNKTNFESPQQLGDMFYKELGYTPEYTEKGSFRTDETMLGKIDHPFIKKFLKIKKLKKTLSTYLIGIQNEVVKGFIHPNFNLHVPRTFRSSSSNPNFQNIPMRNAKIKKLVRQAFIPRRGQRLVECDYGGVEIKVAACYHKDPVMLDYLEDDTKDLHRDMAMEIFMLPKNEITKMLRHAAKNAFVFPQFYGDWYIACAENLWNYAGEFPTESQKDTIEHLKNKGIERLGDLNPKERPLENTFEAHIKRVENFFWNKRFQVYSAWKKSWFETYQKTGFIKTLTGFVCRDFMRKNQVINTPVQSAAFHCLLFSIIELLKKLKKLKMKTLIIGQIHDSIIADVPDNELSDYCKLLEEVMIGDLKKSWDWVITPMEIEIEAFPVDGNWAETPEIKQEMRG